MSIDNRYKELYTAMLEEHKEVFEKQDLKELDQFLERIKKANQIFAMGVGREGLTMKSFAMRLMHLGKKVHWIWDDTTPGLGKGDLFITTNGSGEIGHIKYVIEQAKANGADVIVITGSPLGSAAQLADAVLFVPAAVYKGTDSRVVKSIQPMGNLFEQHCFMLFDLIIMLLVEQMQIPYSEMSGRHRNVE